MPGFNNSTMFADNVDFSGGSPVVGQFTTNGQLLIGSTVAPHIKVGTITAGAGIVVTPGSGTITISSIGGGATWQNISASQALVVDNGYQCTGGAALALSLPAVSVVGDVIEITLDGSTSFSVTQGAGQSIRLGSSATTAGAGGSLTSTAQGDSIRMVCSVANLRWNVLSVIGNITVV